MSRGLAWGDAIGWSHVTHERAGRYATGKITSFEEEVIGPLS